MKFSLSWLKTHLQTNKTTDEIANALTELGLEVEDVINPADKYKNFVIGYVEFCEKHPDADRLSLCKINDGSGELVQVVCGAPNIRQGLAIAFATPGCIVPYTGAVLKKGKIRGIESKGMVCSAKELCLGEDSNGIMELQADAKPGTPLAEFFKLNDTIFDLSITPNRADCFSVRGIARDLAAKGMGILIDLPALNDFPTNSNIDLTIENEDACSYFSLLEIQNVKNMPSPAWLKKRIEDAGQNSISALVDITNFVMFDLGQPLHAFDADNIQPPFGVGLAKKVEKLKALNEEVYDLENDIVVKDKNHVIAIAGVKGGFDSGVSENTKRIYLEAAYFNPVNIAQTGQKFNLFSDARARFERGIDPQKTQYAMKKAAALITEICGGECVNYIERGKKPENIHNILVPLSLFQKRAGQSFNKIEIQQVLERLGFECFFEKDSFYAKTPSYRHDIKTPEEVVEEFLRICSFSSLPEEKLSLVQMDVKKRDPILKLKNILHHQGYDETYTLSMINHDTAKLFAANKNLVEIEKPLTLELATLRSSITPSLLDVVKSNKNKSVESLSIFEYAPVFYKEGDANKQKMCMAGVRFNAFHQENWLEKKRQVDVFDVKSDVIKTLKAYNFNESSIQIDQSDCPNYYHPKRSAKIKQGKKILGYFGEIHPKVLACFGLKQSVVGFEIYCDDLIMLKAKAPKNFSLSIYQPVQRDFAFIADKNLSYEKLLRTIKKVDQKLIHDVKVFDVYDGKGIQDGKKSIALRLYIQADDRTLTDEELMAMQNKIIAVCREIGAEIRDG